MTWQNYKEIGNTSPSRNTLQTATADITTDIIFKITRRRSRK